MTSKEKVLQEAKDKGVEFIRLWFTDVLGQLKSFAITCGELEGTLAEGMRAELRCPDPACNPYLAFAVMLNAGLKGIEEKYELPEPMETNLYHLTESERKQLGIESLPASLGEALAVTERSDLVRQTLGDHAFERFIEVKKWEWDEFRVQVTEWKLKKFLPIL